jgi:mitosis inhibitor protein kinase SWE1
VHCYGPSPSAHRSQRPQQQTLLSFMMLASMSSRDYVSLRNPTRDSALSRSRHYTPPSHQVASSNSSVYDSPMLTPSPLRQRLFIPDHFSVDHNDADDLFMQSPYKLPAQAQQLHSTYTTKPQPITIDDEEGSIFRSSSSVFSPFFPTSDSQPLRTPVKQIHRISSRSALSANHTNTSANRDTETLMSGTLVGVGTKRKSTPHTPLRQHSLTPLVVASGSNAATGIALDRLAPLPAPKFAPGTPHTKAETDAYLQRQTATLTSLRITDLNDSGDEFGVVENDSGCEMDDEDHGDVLFTGSVRLKGGLGKPFCRGPPVNKGKGKDEDEVVEAVSPDGHVNKRRARSRPVSAELLESVQRSPPSQNKVRAFSSNLYLEKLTMYNTSMHRLLRALGNELTV